MAREGQKDNVRVGEKSVRGAREQKKEREEPPPSFLRAHARAFGKMRGLK